MIRCGFTLGLLASCLCLLAGVPPASGQSDPLDLQRRAIQRIDAFIDQFRRTGEFNPASPELVQADRELAASNRELGTLR